MENFICVQCGTQFAETAEPPSRCPICEDERQFVRHTGQEWTTLKQLAANHHNRIEDEAPLLLGIGTEPEFAIGQRALLLQSPGGNLLWDCISLLDDETIAEVNARGGIRAIAISHPHFYSSMIEWAECFDAQIFLHSADREWVMRKSLRIQFWEGSTLSLWDGLTLINCGGHFEGGTVLHWPTGANGKGALLTERHHYRRAGSALRQLSAELSQSHSARSLGDPPHRRKNRTFLIRADLWRLVAGERSRRCKSSRCAIRRTLSALDQSLRFVIPVATDLWPVSFGRLDADGLQDRGYNVLIQKRSAHRQCAARRSQPARALTALRIVRAAFPQDSLQ